VAQLSTLGRLAILDMKPVFLILAVAAGLFGCSRSPDAIDRLMIEVSHEVVASYMFQPIDLPATASPAQLVATLPNKYDIYWTGRKITSYKIVLTRAAQSGPNEVERYTAVLLDTNAGQKIVLLRPMTTSGKWDGWYYKIYDVK